jgi:hypothetical protein
VVEWWLGDRERVLMTALLMAHRVMTKILVAGEMILGIGLEKRKRKKGATEER